MNIAPTVTSVRQVASYVQLKPLVRAVVESNDSLPKTSLPTEVPGSVQSQAKLLPPVTLYTEHGKIAKNSPEPGNLIAYA
jgi:hypothetical protein